MAIVELAFAGKRVNDKYKIMYKYVDQNDGRRALLFASKLGKFDVLGDIIKCEETETGVKGPYSKTGIVAEELITRFSVEQANHMENKEAYNRSKDIPNGHVKALIDAVKRNTHSASDRKRLALYIFDQLT